MSYALYFEFEDGDRLRQYLLIPGCTSGATVIQPALAARTVRGVRVSSWQVQHSANYQLSVRQEADPLVIIREELEQLSGIAPVLVGALADPSLVLKDPLVIALTPNQIGELAGAPSKLPASLKFDISEARKGAGFKNIEGAVI